MQSTAIERAVTGDSDPRERNSQAGGAGIVCSKGEEGGNSFLTTEDKIPQYWVL